MNQQQQSQISLQAHFNTASSDDDFLEQTLSSCSWPDISTGATNSTPLPWDLPTSLRQQPQQIATGNSTTMPSSSPAMSLLLQQQLLLSRGLAGGLSSPTGMSGAGDSGLLPVSLSLGNGDCYDRSRSDVLDSNSFDSPNPGQDASVQALLNGFTESLYGSEQISNIAHQFQHHQRGAMETQSYGTPATVTNQTPANGSAGGTPAATRQRVRARRGQATDPHSIAERLRRERIAERMKGLQELVPNANKTDKASMLDEIIDYVNFLRLQVKVLSMSRLGGAAAVSPLVADISSSEGGGECIQGSGGVGGKGNVNGTQTASTNNSIKVTEHQVAKLMEEDMGSAMQYLQSKGLCLMPISLATAISTATTGNHHRHGGPGGPSSPNLSVLTGQSATLGNGVTQNSAKDSTSVSKP